MTDDPVVSPLPQPEPLQSELVVWRCGICGSVRDVGIEICPSCGDGKAVRRLFAYDPEQQQPAAQLRDATETIARLTAQLDVANKAERFARVRLEPLLAEVTSLTQERDLWQRQLDGYGIGRCDNLGLRIEEVWARAEAAEQQLANLVADIKTAFGERYENAGDGEHVSVNTAFKVALQEERREAQDKAEAAEQQLATLTAAVEQLIDKWREISSRPNRPTGFLICADELAALVTPAAKEQL
jgi:chromosome segregation ATPase